MTLEIILLFCIVSVIIKIFVMWAIEYEFKWPRVSFFWTGMLIGWIEMFILVRYVL